MRSSATLLALLLILPACSGVRSPRRDRRHRQSRGQAASRETASRETASREDDIRAVIEMTRTDDVSRREVHRTIDDLSDALQQIAPPEARRGLRQMFGDVEDEINAVDMTGMAVDVYARNLSADDARALRAFYETPAGRRIAAASGDIAEDLSDEAERVGEQIGARIASRVQGGEYGGFGEARAESRRERRRRRRGEE